MTNKKPIILENKEGSAAKPQRSLPRLLEHIRDLSIRELDKLLTKMLDEADDVLFDLADKALSNKDQSCYFDSMRELRVKRRGMEKIFSRELHNNFLLLQDTEELAQENNNIEQLTTDSLSLVHEDELEESLAVEAMVIKAIAINKTALRQMVTRFDTLLANVRVSGANNPLSPRILCETFRETAKPLEMDIKARLVIYKLFDRIVVAKFDHVYNEINSFLINSGVLPDLKSTGGGAYKNPQAHQVTTPSNTEEPMVDVGSEYLGTLRGLLTEQKTGMVAPMGTGGSAPLNPHVTEIFLDPLINNHQLVHALSAVQLDVRQQPASGQGHFPVADLRHQIGKALAVPGPVSSETIGQDSDDVIDIIAMLFDYILDDKNLPDEFKALIGRLQIPMLKVALIDETFFSKGNHPARKLLNEMAHAGVGWTVGGGVGLRDKVEEIVTLIVNDFDDDTSLFVEALNNFQAFNEQHQKRASLIEKRTQEAEEGKARAANAKSASKTALNKVIGLNQLPQTIHNFIFSDWLNVMLLTHLREGDDSKEWKNQIKTAEKLITSFTPATTKASKKQLTDSLPELIGNIQSGLEAVGHGEYEAEQFFAELESIHHRVLKGESIFLEENQVIELAPVKGSAAEFSGQTLPLATVEELEINQSDDMTAQGTDTRASGSYFDSSLSDHGSIQDDDEFLVLVNNLQAGGWFEKTHNDKSSRCKLAAVISSVGKYIFVNHTGKKIAEYTKVDLALAFRRGEITQLDDGVLFDRALKSIVTDFRTKKYLDAGM